MLTGLRRVGAGRTAETDQEQRQGEERRDEDPFHMLRPPFCLYNG